MYWFAILFTAILLSAYCVLILLYRHWFIRLKEFQYSKDQKPQTSFTIIVPARNEEKHIGQLINALMQQDYPSDLYEVILINDHSTDETERIIAEAVHQFPNVKLLNLTDHIEGQLLNAYKKKSIEIAIGKSSGEWIITTDADCTMGQDWLRAFDTFITKTNTLFVAAPVMFTNDDTLLSRFQLLDFLSLQGITAAAVSAGFQAMCNGANIAYKKSVFEEVGGFTGIEDLASGDEMLLMNKVKQQYPTRIGYLFSKDALVCTAPMPDWRRFINQRIRWASKAETYKDRKIFWTLMLVYLLNVMLLVIFVAATFNQNGFNYWIILICIKTLVELSFMLPVAHFYDQTEVLGWFPFMQPLHVLYTVVAGWLGKFGSYQWKGRKVH